MRAIKLTDANGMTRNRTQWGEGVTNEAVGYSNELCSSGFIHGYKNEYIASFISPAHVAWWDEAKFWEAEFDGDIKRDGLKLGSRKCTTIREIEPIRLTTEQRVTIAIKCVKKVYKDESWNLWADRWLSGEDRSYSAAKAALDDTDVLYADSAHTDAAAYAADAAAYAGAGADADYAAEAALCSRLTADEVTEIIKKVYEGDEL